MTPPDNAIAVEHPRLSVVIPPGQQNDVAYYDRLDRVLLITNLTSGPILIERVNLRFQSDSERGSELVSHRCSVELAANASTQLTIPIVPNAQFLPYTNTFDTVVWLRTHTASGFSDTIEEPHHPPAYIVVGWPRQDLGRVFISFKQPQDRELKNTMAEVARRAGFTPWTAEHDSHVGADTWSDIEASIHDSVAVVFLWTEETAFTDGVKREVALCRKHGVREKPLLQKGIPIPEPYQGSRINHQLFDAQTPTRVFATVIQQLRDEVLGTTRA